MAICTGCALVPPKIHQIDTGSAFGISIGDDIDQAKSHLLSQGFKGGKDEIPGSGKCGNNSLLSFQFDDDVGGARKKVTVVRLYTDRKSVTCIIWVKDPWDIDL
jgi:hypothetical protein